LIVFLDAVLNKRYGNPGADIITVLAGLDDVDAILSDFVAVLDETIRAGKISELIRVEKGMAFKADTDAASTRIKAVRVAIITITGTYHTALSSYFISKDLFPGLIKVSVTSSCLC
jgi:hypothetical protein